MLDSQKTREIVSQLFADVAAGNIDGVYAAMAPDIVFDLPRTEFNLAIPNTGRWLGREGVMEAFRLRGERTDITAFEQRDMVVEKNRAFVINFQRIRHRATGFETEFEFSMILTLREDGRIRHWKAFFDASGEVAMFRSDVNDRLLAAIRDGDDRRVTALLREGADPNHRDEDTGLTLFQTAAGLGDAGIVRLLLDAGGDVWGTDRRAGTTALHKAVQRGDLDTVRLLVEAGAFVDAVAPTTGHTPLMDALWFKWPDIVAHLLDRGAGLGLNTHYGFSLQEHFDYELNVNTTGKDKLLASEALLKQRRETDARAAAEQRLMEAVTAGDLATVRDLIASGAELEARHPVLNGFNDGHTPLLVAARDGHEQIVAALVAAGADVNATEPVFGASPLHKAVYNGHTEIARTLAGAPGVDLDHQGATNGYTALHDALWHGYEDCARVLLGAGARTDLVGHDGKRPVDIAREALGADHPLARHLAEREA